MDSHQVEGRQRCSFARSYSLPRIDVAACRAAGPRSAFRHGRLLTLPAISRPPRAAAEGLAAAPNQGAPPSERAAPAPAGSGTTGHRIRSCVRLLSPETHDCNADCCRSGQRQTDGRRATQTRLAPHATVQTALHAATSIVTTVVDGVLSIEGAPPQMRHRRAPSWATFTFRSRPSSHWFHD